MARYKIDGIEYEIADGVDLKSAVEKIRALPDHGKPAEEPSYGKRILTEGLPAAAAGIGNMAVDIGRSAGAGLIGLGTAIGTGSMSRGAEELGHAMEASKEVIPEIPDKSQGAFSGVLEKGIGYLGDLGEQVSEPGGSFNTGNMSEFSSPEGRTLTEAAANFAPLPGTKMVGKLPHVGTEWKNAQAFKATQEHAAALLAEEKAKIDKAQADAEAYDKAYAEIDNTQRPYGRDLQAPQYGQGGKLARHEDQGKSEYPRIRSDRNAAQEAFDADMARLADEFNVTRLKEEQEARFVDRWQEQQDRNKPRTEADDIADEIRNKMAERDQPLEQPSVRVAEIKTPEEMFGPEADGGIAYHGSPFHFTEFDASKIGSGEGASAKGYGIYITDTEGVGKSYVNSVSQSFEARALVPIQSQINALKAQLRDHTTYRRDNAFLTSAEKVGIKQKIQQLEQQLQKQHTVLKPTLYKVEFPDTWQTQFLNWDKSWDQQSPHVQQVVKSFSSDILQQIQEIYGNTGEALYRGLSDQYSKAQVSNLLAEKGIPGIKYLDQQSRTASSGTHNYVIFPGLETQLKIISRNNKAVGSQIINSPKSGFNYGLANKMRENVSSRNLLEHIRDTSNIPYYRELSKMLLSDDTFNPRFNLTHEDIVIGGKTHAPTGNPYMGLMDYTKNQITVHRRALGHEALLLHEFVHARTHNGIELALRNVPVASHLRPAVIRLTDLYNAFVYEYKGSGNFNFIKRQRMDKGRSANPYGLMNIHEFIAEGFTNPEFQSYLARTPLPANLKRSGILSYWDSFVDKIGQLLGFKRDSQNYLSELIRVGADIMGGTDRKIRLYWDQKTNPLIPGSDRDSAGHMVGGYSILDFERDLKDKGISLAPEVMKGIYEKKFKKTVVPDSGNKAEPVLTVTREIDGLRKLQRELQETRTLKEMTSEIEQTPDIGPVTANVIGKIINGDYMAKDHPILSWTSSAINQIKNTQQKTLHNLLYGENGTRHQPAPGSFYHQWSQLSVKERIEVNDIGQALNNSQFKLTDAGVQAKAKELFGKELSAKQLQSYKDRLAINSKVLEQINSKLREAGKETINELPHYWSPSEFEGRFLAIIKQKNGEGTIVRGSYLRPDEKKLASVFTNHDIKIVERGIRSSFDFAQYEMILRHLEKELRDPASRAIAEGYRRAGFGRHGLKREGAAGAMGTEGGRKGLDRYEEVSEKYIRQSMEYTSARDLDKAFNELQAFEPAKKSPYAHSYALEALDQARGGMNKTMENLSQMIGDIFSGVGRVATVGKVVLPSSALRDVLKGGNQAKSALLLGFLNLQFMAANLMQSTYALPKLLGMAAEYGKMGLLDTPITATKAMYRTTAMMLNQKHPDIKKLDAIGTFDATMKYDWSSYASDAVKFKHTLKDHLTGMSTNAFIESNAVRKPAALMFLNMLRELGYDKVAKHPDDIYNLTKSLTEDYMVSFERHKKPAVFARTGLVGTVFGPLQSFTTTWIAQLREYTKQAGKTHQNPANALPLASFLALNVVTAGLIGTIGVKEWDALAEFLNTHFNMNVPTGTETILKNTKSDIARFGVLSDALGVHIGATFSAPTLTGTGAPGAQLLFDAGQALFRGIKETGIFGEMNKPTEAEKRDSFKALTPRSYAWGQIEKAYTPKDRPLQTAKGSAGPYTRTEKDWFARMVGTYTLDEVKGKVGEYPVERQAANRTARLQKSAHLIVDSLLHGEQPEKRIEALVKELAKDNYSGREITESVKNQLKAQVTEKDVRMMGQGKTTRQKLIIQMYGELR